jgi:5-methylcytosine-specific restriction endonuclease McrA
MYYCYRHIPAIIAYIKQDNFMSRTMSSGRNEQICELYTSKRYTTQAIATAFSMSRRRVQQIVTAAGLIRTRAESNRVVAPLKPKHRIRRRKYESGTVKRRRPDVAVRYTLLNKNPWCALCGMTAKDGVQLHLDHIDNDPRNNDPSNFQVLCNQCNVGKYWASLP